MYSHLATIKTSIYNLCNVELTNYKNEEESHEYEACRFMINGSKVIGRTAKITPKKVGQFVTFWQRNKEGVTEPFKDLDNFAFFVVTVQQKNQIGQFIFPKSALIQRKILSTNLQEGKRGFRVYPNWDEPTSKQAIKTQTWQLDYFYEVGDSTDLKKVADLFSNQ